MEKITSTLILETLRTMAESKKMISKEEWLNTAMKLESFRYNEAKALNVMRQAVAKKKVEIIRGQEKKNVAAAEIEIEATDEYRFMKDQEDLLYSIDEFVRIAKKQNEF